MELSRGRTEGGNAMSFKVYWKKMLEYFEDEDWPLYDVDHEDRSAIAYMKGDHLTLRIFVWLDEGSKTLNLSWHYPNAVPRTKYHLILELMNQLNYRTFVGKFVMNANDGSLSYRISLPVKHLPFSKKHFEELIWRGMFAADEEYPKFMSLIYGGWTVDEVLEGKGQPYLQVVSPSEEAEEVELPEVVAETEG
jgi:hypothetical protein